MIVSDKSVMLLASTRAKTAEMRRSDEVKKKTDSPSKAITSALFDAKTRDQGSVRSTLGGHARLPPTRRSLLSKKKKREKKKKSNTRREACPPKIPCLSTRGCLETCQPAPDPQN